MQENKTTILNSEPVTIPALDSIISGLTGTGFVVDEDNLDAIRKFMAWAYRLPEFETMGKNYSLSKGIILVGGIGVGKTTLCRMYFQSLDMSNLFLKCNNLALRAAGDGKQGRDTFSKIIQTYGLGYKKALMGFDDLGTEDRAVMSFGNKVNIMAELLDRRYENFTDFGARTIITTNLGPDTIETYYGDRIRSRIREMCNHIAFPKTAKDRRK